MKKNKNVYMFSSSVLAALMTSMLFSTNVKTAEIEVKEDIVYENTYLKNQILKIANEEIESQIQRVIEEAGNSYENGISIEWQEDEVIIENYSWDKGREVKATITGESVPDKLYMKNENNEIVATLYLANGTKKEYNEFDFKKNDYSELLEEVFKIEKENAKIRNTHNYYGYIQDTDGTYFYAEYEEYVSNQLENIAKEQEFKILDTLDKVASIDNIISDMDIDKAYDCLINTDRIKVIQKNESSITYGIDNTIVCEYTS